VCVTGGWGVNSAAGDAGNEKIIASCANTGEKMYYSVLTIIRDVIAQALKRNCSEKSRHIHFVECANTAIVDGRMSYAAQNIRLSNSLFNYSMEMCGALIIQSTVSAVDIGIINAPTCFSCHRQNSKAESHP
jgi:hypothetical protein